jgi:hypothetical protein
MKSSGGIDEWVFTVTVTQSWSICRA